MDLKKLQELNDLRLTIEIYNDLMVNTMMKILF